MNALDDTLAAFDELIDWLKRHPNHEPTKAFGHDLYVLRHPGEYGSELLARTHRVVGMINHLLREDNRLPDDYMWRRFRETVESGCTFDYGGGFRYDVKGQQEILRVVASARDDLVRRYGGTVASTPKAAQLTDIQYENVLNLIRQWGESLERNPEAFRHMGEEDLRATCLAMLQTHFPGRATAETSNNDGRTDLFLRVEEAGAAFIAECKMWSGPKGVSQAIDQLLGYLTWRDNKAALILFNRLGNLTRVVSSASDAAVKQSSHLQRIPHIIQNESRHVFRHPNDNARQVTVTIQIYDVPKRE